MSSSSWPRIWAYGREYTFASVIGRRSTFCRNPALYSISAAVSCSFSASVPGAASAGSSVASAFRFKDPSLHGARACGSDVCMPCCSARRRSRSAREWAICIWRRLSRLASDCRIRSTTCEIESRGATFVSDSCVRTRLSYIVTSVNPCSDSDVTVRSTCSMQGEKQQIRVEISWRSTSLANGTASHGAGKSRNTASALFVMPNPSLHTLR